MELETERLFIRPFEIKDLPLLEKLHGNEEVMRYHPGHLPRPKERILKDLETIINHQMLYGFSFWAVFEKNGNFIGRTGLWHLDKTEKIEVGYSLFKDFWGKGLATEMTKAVLAKGFNDFNLEQIFAVIHIQNTNSHKVVKKLGFTFVEESTYYNMPTRLYSLKKEEIIF